MKILILQHIAIEDPGTIKDFMLQDGYELVTIELDAGEKIPENLDSFDGMLCMGGPMDTWMEEKYPWLVEEKRRIHEFVVEMKKPFLGICLGCQLLGEVVGGKVVRSIPSEIGILPVLVNARQDPLFGAMPNSIQTLQWHSYEVAGLEDNPQIAPLASSPITQYQVFRYQSHAYGVQFHIEIRPDTVRSWGEIAEYKEALEQTLGANALAEMDTQAATSMAEMNHHATLLYSGFKQLLKKS